MTWILHLETATRACSVCLSENGKLRAVKESVSEEFSHGENLTLYIQDVLEQAQISIQDLAAVSVASGPGSYTGLRIGVSTAKGICYALNIPLLCVDSLRSMAEIARKKYPNENLLPVIDARRMEVYSAIYGANFEVLKPISADVIDAQSYSSFSKLVCFGDGASKLQDIWGDRAIQFDLEIHASAVGQILLSTEKLKLGEIEDVAYFEPFYLKDFVSTQKKL